MSGNAPALFAKCNRWGVPWPATLLSAAISCLAYLNVASGTSVVFNWFINLTTLVGFISWASCILIFIRFRAACKVQGIVPPYRSKFQPWLGYISGAFFASLILLNGFNVFFPGRFNPSDFVTYYVGIPIFLFFYLGHRLFTYKTLPWIIPSNEVDLYTGLDVIEAMEVVELPIVEKKRTWFDQVKKIWE